MKDNTIYVKVQEGSLAILEFPDYNIKTQAYIGKKGASKIKIEGNKKTPIGIFDLGIALGTHSNEEMQNKLKIHYEQITDDMYWVDDSNSKYYNKLVSIKNTEKDWDSAEHLIDFPTEYEYLVEIKTNPDNIPNQGSAIFLHCTQNEPTLGCVGINREIMEKIITLIDTNTKISITK